MGRRDVRVVSYDRREKDERIDHRSVTRNAFLLTGLFWLLLLYPALFDASMSEKLRALLGERPSGMPYERYVLLFTLQLTFPMLFFFHYLLITVTYARRRERTIGHAGDLGAVVGLVGYMRYLARDTGEGPEIRRAKLFTLAGILYLIGVVAWWIWWTDKHGL